MLSALSRPLLTTDVSHRRDSPYIGGARPQVLGMPVHSVAVRMLYSFRKCGLLIC